MRGNIQIPFIRRNAQINIEKSENLNEFKWISDDRFVWMMQPPNLFIYTPEI